MVSVKRVNWPRFSLRCTRLEWSLLCRSKSFSSSSSRKFQLLLKDSKNNSRGWILPLQCWPLIQSWPIGLQENNNISRKLVLGQSVAHKKNNKLLEAQNLDIFKKAKCFSRLKPDNVFLFKTLHIPLTQAVILSSTSNFFANAGLNPGFVSLANGV